MDIGAIRARYGRFPRRERREEDMASGKEHKCAI
jgi:hypothetical protein